MSQIIGCDRWVEGTPPPETQVCAQVIRQGTYFKVDLTSQDGSFRQDLDLCPECCRIMLRFMSTGGTSKYESFTVTRARVA